MNDRNQERTPTRRERGQSVRGVRFTSPDKQQQSIPGPVLEQEKSPQQITTDELKNQFPELQLSESVNSVSTPTRPRLKESHLSSIQRGKSPSRVELPPITDESSSTQQKPNQESLPVITVDTIKSGDITTLAAYLARGGDPSTILINGFPIIIHVLMVVTSPFDYFHYPRIRNNQIDQFYLLLRNTRLDCGDNTSEYISKYLEKSTAVNMNTLETARRTLYIEALTVWRRLNSEVYKQSEELENYLVRSGLESGPMPSYNNNDIMLLENYIKLICSGFICRDKPNQYNRSHIDKLIQGLLSIAKPDEIIRTIQLLWKDFELKQRFIAIIIIKELLITDMYQSHIEHASLIEVLSILTRDYLSVMPVHGETIKKSFEAMVATARKYKQNYCFQNYLTLEVWLCKPKVTPSLELIDDLLKKSLQNPEEQLRVADIITNELSALMLLRFKHLKIREFYNEVWKSEHKNIHAPNLLAIISLINNITLFVEHTILSADSATNASRFIGLFIIITQKLCHSRGECGPDLCSAAAVMMGLTAAPVARLNHYFNMLPDQLLALFKALEKLLDQGNNSKGMRQMMIAYPHALPYLGCIQKDLVFIHEGNKEFINLGSLLGGVYEEMSHLQRRILMIPCVFKTNLMEWLSIKALITDQELEDLSHKHNSPKWSIQGLTFDEIHTQLTKYLDRRVVPTIVTKDNDMNPANEAYKPLCEYLSVCLYRDPSQDNNHNIRRARRLIHYLFDVIQKNNPQLQLHNTSLHYLDTIPLQKPQVAPATTDITRSAVTPAKKR